MGRKDDERKFVSATMLDHVVLTLLFSLSPTLFVSILSSSPSLHPPSTDYEKVITHYIQLYRYNDALKVLTEKASEALQQHGSEAVGREGQREGQRWKGWYEEIPYNNFITENFPPMTLCIIR